MDRREFPRDRPSDIPYSEIVDCIENGQFMRNAVGVSGKTLEPWKHSQRLQKKCDKRTRSKRKDSFFKSPCQNLVRCF